MAQAKVDLSEEKIEKLLDKKDDKQKKKTNGNKKTNKLLSSFRGINLIGDDEQAKDEKESKKLVNKLITSFFVAVIFSALVYGAAIGYGYLKDQELTDIKGKLNDTNQQISIIEAQSTKLIKFQDRLTQITKILNNHVYWSEFFAELEKNTISDVTYINFTTSGNNSVTLSAIGKNYSALAKQLLAFQQANKLVDIDPKDNKSRLVTINSGNSILGVDGSIEGVNFNVSIKINPSVLIKNNGDLK